MAVYVDKAQHAYGRMKMCHMLADTPGELFAMADEIGVDRRWYQGFEKASCPHFDIAKSKRELALLHGAVEVERVRFGAVIREIKDAAIESVRRGVSHGWEAPTTPAHVPAAGEAA